jgi:hypothetical protein
VEELEAALAEQGGGAGGAGALAGHIKQILAEVDRDSDGRIDFEEFCAMMHAGNEDVSRAARRGMLTTPKL